MGYRNYVTSECFERIIEAEIKLQVLEDHSRPVLSLAIADNKLFSGSYDYTIKVWSLDTLQRLKTLTGEPHAGHACTICDIPARKREPKRGSTLRPLLLDCMPKTCLGL